MRIALVTRLVAAFTLCIASAGVVFACRCGGGFREKNAWENVRKAVDGHSIIFEGTPTKLELRWDLLDAKEGELIAADVFLGPSWTEGQPQMVVTFRVARTYKGYFGPEVQVHTGLGGGDCGAVYMPGLTYLVYAGGPSPDRLGVSMCSPGGWLEGTEVATDLRYLRKERAISTDLVPILRWSQAGYDKQQKEQQRRYAESRRRLDAATGRICGTLIHSDPKDNGKGSMAFLSTLGYSPNDPPYGEVKEDGSFCSRNLGPGTYYLYFVQQDDQGTSALYYPGVTDVAKATRIEVRPGQTQSNIVFKVTKQPSYSVRGFIFADQRPDFSNNVQITSPVVALVRSDGDRRVWFSGKAWFILPKTAYFTIDHVVPGRYLAFVQMPGQDWMERKVEFDVTGHMKFISLRVVHKK